MNIAKITIRNFRNIEDEQSFSLNSNFTTIIGINGKGKSTILHSIRIACGAYLLGIPEVAKRHIWEKEIRRKDLKTHIVLLTPTVIKAEGTLNDQQLRPWIRQIPAGKTKTTSNSEDVGEIRAIARQKYEEINIKGNINVDNPVIAYFGTGRLYGSSRNTLGNYSGREIFKYGYYNWSDMQYGSYQYINWLRSFDFLLKDEKENPENLDAFYETVKNANPYITDIGFDGMELRLKVKMIDGEEESGFLPLSLHSDGMITHTAMVAELAFRCIILNSHHKKNSIQQSKGIVMIDEIDLHLHPNWQRHVVSDLKNAFPNIQFVATTHSPFIVQSLNSSELINLDKATDYNPNELSLEEVAEDIMGVSSDMSIENQTDEEISTQYFEILSAKISDENKDIELNNLEGKISDPAVRAFLKMNRLKNS